MKIPIRLKRKNDEKSHLNQVFQKESIKCLNEEIISDKVIKNEII